MCTPLNRAYIISWWRLHWIRHDYFHQSDFKYFLMHLDLKFSLTERLLRCCHFFSGQYWGCNYVGSSIYCGILYASHCFMMVVLGPLSLFSNNVVNYFSIKLLCFEVEVQGMPLLWTCLISQWEFQAVLYQYNTSGYIYRIHYCFIFTWWCCP